MENQDDIFIPNKKIDINKLIKNPSELVVKSGEKILQLLFDCKNKKMEYDKEILVSKNNSDEVKKDFLNLLKLKEINKKDTVDKIIKLCKSAIPTAGIIAGTVVGFIIKKKI